MARTPKPLSTAAALAAWDEHQLVALFQRRPDLLNPAPRTLAALADRVESVPSAQAAYRRLDASARQVLDAFALLPRPTQAAVVASILAPGVSASDLERPLTLLSESALLYRAGDHLTINPGLARVVSRARVGPPAATVLGAHSAHQLSEMCHRLGERPGASKSATLVAIASILADAARVHTLIRNGPAGTADLAYDVARRGPEVRLSGGHYYADDRTPAGWLLGRGFLVPSSWDRAVMPGEVCLALRGGYILHEFSPDAPDLHVRAVDQDRVDAAATEEATRLVADIATVLAGWSDQPAKLLKDGGVVVRDLRRSAKAIERSERDTARLVDVAMAAGLAWIDDTAAIAVPTPAYDEWLQLEPALRWAHLVTAWYEADLHPSLAGATGAKDKPIPPLLRRFGEPNAAARRRQVLEAMAGVAGGFGSDAASIGARARWLSPDIWEGGPALPAMLSDWAVEECALLGLWAHGSLSAMGRPASDGNFGDAAEALAARLPATVSEFVLQADLTAVAAGALTVDVAAELELLADVESRGAATVFRFSDASLRRAFDAGRTAEGIAAFLEGHAASRSTAPAVPQALAYLVADIGRRHGRARVGPARTYIRSDDEALLAEVAQARSTAKARLRRLAPTVLVSDAEPAVVLAVLRGAGYLPAEEDSTGAVTVTRPPVRRAHSPVHAGVGSPLPAGEAHARSGSADLAAPAAVAAALRKAPRSKPEAVSPAEREGEATLPLPLSAEEERPSHIAKSPERIREVLQEALDHEWLVRVSYTNAKGAASQINLWPIDVSDDLLLAECLPRYDERKLRLDRVGWARVLTEIEEDQYQ